MPAISPIGMISMYASIRFPQGVVMVAALIAQSAFAATRAAPFTIEEVMQAPYPSSLVAAAGNSAAWVFDTKGVRNIWLAQGNRSRQITSYTLDDGFDIGDLALSPDVSLAAYVRGQSLEDDLPANVNSSAEGASPREVWVIPTAGGNPRKAGAGHSPNYSPDGTRLVYSSTRAEYSRAHRTPRQPQVH